MGNSHSNRQKYVGEGRSPAREAPVSTFCVSSTSPGNRLESHPLLCCPTLDSVNDRDCIAVGDPEKMVHRQFDKLRALLEERERCLLEEISQYRKTKETAVAADSMWSSTPQWGETVTMSLKSLAGVDEEHMVKLLRQIRHVWAHDTAHVFVVGGRDRTIKVMSDSSCEPLQTLQGHDKAVTACAVAREGRTLVSASQDGTAIVWDTEMGEQVTRFTGHTGALSCVSVTSDGSKAVTGSRDCSLLMWSTETGDIETHLKGHTDWCYDCQITPDDRMLVSASADKTLRVWDLETGQTVQVLVGHSGAVLCCAVTDDGSRIVSGSRDGTARVWDPVTGNTLMKLHDHTDWIMSCCLVDETTVATGSADRNILLWDIDTGEEKHKLQGHFNWVNSLTPINDGNKLISVSEDRRLCKWDVKTGQCEEVIPAETVWRSAASAPAASPGRKAVQSVVALGLLEGRFSKDAFLRMRLRSLDRCDLVQRSASEPSGSPPSLTSSFTLGRKGSRLSKTMAERLSYDGHPGITAFSNPVYSASSKGSTSPHSVASRSYSSSGAGSPPAPMTPCQISETSNEFGGMCTVRVTSASPSGTGNKMSFKSMVGRSIMKKQLVSRKSKDEDLLEAYEEPQKIEKFGCMFH